MSQALFRKVLIANRGEIARRIMAACREMGISTVAVYSEADRYAPFVREADEAYLLGLAPATQSYLKMEKVIEVAKQAGAEAIHPGYGFLAENASFARACEAAGIVFIGPPAEVIQRLGDKSEAKRLAMSAAVPIVPGYMPQGDVSSEQLLEEARKIGFPVLLKAVAGGGGKGMRAVWDESEFLGACDSAAREAKSAFGDDRLMIERYVQRPRHIEVQILGDTRGNLIHLFERECSVQRRHQKIVEESPSPALTPALREQICAAAVRLTKAAGYTNAGTVEFLLETPPNEEARFYFLEVNTRLQVEHPVTEWVTGIDLVQWQIRIAAGQPLTLRQEDVQSRGHAIEARLCAEDPAQDFLPATGTVTHWRSPALPGWRVDAGVESGSEISPYYDSMLAKVIAYAADRECALNRMCHGLSSMEVAGIKTNLAFLKALVSHPAFRAGDLHTGFLEEHAEIQKPEKSAPPEEVLLALAAAETLPRQESFGATTNGSDSDYSLPWRALAGWRLGVSGGIGR